MIAVTLAAIVDPTKLVELVVAAAVAGTVVTTVFAVAVLGAVRAREAGRASRTLRASAYGLLTLLATAIALGISGYGLSLVITRS